MQLAKAMLVNAYCVSFGLGQTMEQLDLCQMRCLFIALMAACTRVVLALTDGALGVSSLQF